VVGLWNGLSITCSTQHTAHKNDCEAEQNVCVPAPVDTWLSVLHNDLLIA
jgi:hypothetical protein